MIYEKYSFKNYFLSCRYAMFSFNLGYFYPFYPSKNVTLLVAPKKEAKK